jgi:Trypsin
MRQRMNKVVFISSVCVMGLGCAAEASRSDDGQPVLTTQQRIIGGTVDVFRSYVVGVGNGRGPFCSGTVISRRTVITAGHCHRNAARIFFGTSLDRRGALAVPIVKAVRHPSYDAKTLENDISVLQLAADSPVQAAPLLRESMVNDTTFVGPDFIFVGYGYSDGVSGTGFGTRRVVEFPIAAVGPAVVGGTPGSIGPTQFYYQVPLRNTCNGDSGGPAFIARRGVERHAGVTSFGDDPCTLDGVQARTDAAQITTFIQPLIDEFEAGDPCRADGVCQDACNTGPQLVDPDCAELHCGFDGICALSCIAPRDPDCPRG